MTLVIAHRGASAYEPENTLPAFRAAVEFGSDGIELDVHGTADGVIVVHHDPVIDGVAIGDMSYADLARRGGPDKSAIPPTLSEALQTIGAETIVYIEVKSMQQRHDAAFMHVIATAPNPDNCQVHAFDHRIVHRLLVAEPELRGGVLSASYPVDPVRQVSDARADTLWQQDSLIDEDLVQAVHAAGKTIIAWTVDAEEQMLWLQQIGVDGVCSNRPDVARRVLQ